MPRRYTLGKRRDQQDATRERIVAAAAELFRVQGATHTSVPQIAAAADVAPGTVRNHFPTTEALASAVAAHIMARLRMPDRAVFARLSHDDVPARVAGLARAMAAYYERSRPWYRIAELDDRPLEAWVTARATYEAEYEALVATALGPLASDREAVTIVAGLLDPGAMGALAARGLSMAAAADTIAGLLAPWLEARLARPR